VKPFHRTVAVTCFVVCAVSACDPLVNDPIPREGGSSTNGGPSEAGSNVEGSSGISDDSGSQPRVDDGPNLDVTSSTMDGAAEASSGANGDSGVGPCPGQGAIWNAGVGLNPQGPPAWNATASSTFTSTNPSMSTSPGMAFDHNQSTRWSTGQPQQGNEWFKIDLGQATRISQVLLFVFSADATDYPVSYTLGLSTDDATYMTVATGNGTAPATAICLPQQSARYVKISQTGSAPIAWWSIDEIAIVP